MCIRDSCWIEPPKACRKAHVVGFELLDNVLIIAYSSGHVLFQPIPAPAALLAEAPAVLPTAAYVAALGVGNAPGQASAALPRAVSALSTTPLAVLAPGLCLSVVDPPKQSTAAVKNGCSGFAAARTSDGGIRVLVAPALSVGAGTVGSRVADAYLITSPASIWREGYRPQLSGHWQITPVRFPPSEAGAGSVVQFEFARQGSMLGVLYDDHLWQLLNTGDLSLVSQLDLALCPGRAQEVYLQDKKGINSASARAKTGTDASALGSGRKWTLISGDTCTPRVFDVVVVTSPKHSEVSEEFCVVYPEWETLIVGQRPIALVSIAHVALPAGMDPMAAADQKDGDRKHSSASASVSAVQLQLVEAPKRVITALNIAVLPGKSTQSSSAGRDVADSVTAALTQSSHVIAAELDR